MCWGENFVPGGALTTWAMSIILILDIHSGITRVCEKMGKVWDFSQQLWLSLVHQHTCLSFCIYPLSLFVEINFWTKARHFSWADLTHWPSRSVSSALNNNEQIHSQYTTDKQLCIIYFLGSRFVWHLLQVKQPDLTIQVFLTSGKFQVFLSQKYTFKKIHFGFPAWCESSIVITVWQVWSFTKQIKAKQRPEPVSGENPIYRSRFTI